jgi:hypothetical protein
VVLVDHAAEHLLALYRPGRSRRTSACVRTPGPSSERWPGTGNATTGKPLTYPPAHRDEVASTFAVMAAAMLVEACGGTAEAIALAARWTGKITARSGRAVIARDASAA